MKALIQATKTRLATIPELKTIRVYNNQFEQLETGEYEGIFLPATFIELVNDLPAMQLGAGYQLFEIVVRIHIAHEFYNGDNMEENLDVFDLKDSVYKALQKFEPDGAAAFARVAEGQDYTHTNLYHYTIDFATSFIDAGMKEPINGTQSSVPVELIVNASLVLPENSRKLLTESGFVLLTESGDTLAY